LQIAAHIASSILDKAKPGQIVASRIVKDLVVRSGAKFDDLGETELRDIEGSWSLHSVVSVPT
jgi:class 3 adenylate cyclase